MAERISRPSNTTLQGGGNRGGLPPATYGGGGGGGGRGDGDGLHDFRHQLQRYRLGLLFTIASIVMLFISFTTLFVARRGAGKYDPLTGNFQSDWTPLALPMKILLIDTAILLASCLVVEIARRTARTESVLLPLNSIPGVRATRQSSVLWVWATVLLGTGFLIGQYFAWQQIRAQANFATNGPASAFFYLLTGAHALHLAAGLVVLLYACLASGPRHSQERRCIALDVTAWYWHFIGLTWIYVFLVLKLMD